MDNFALSRWLLILLSAVAVSGALDPRLQHLFLNYIPPFQFLKGYGENAAHYAYEPFRVKRSVTSHVYHPMPHPISNPMSYAYGFGFNPVHYPFKMISYPFRYPMMPGLNLMSYGPSYPYTYSAPKRSAGMQPADSYDKGYDSNMGYHSNMAYDTSYAPAYSSHPFGHDFMSMMGFNFNKISSVPSPVNANFNFNNKPHTPSFDNGRFNFDKINFPKPSKGGNNYDMSYSNSYSMDMDYKNGKGHMVTKDSSYMNDNGNVEVHDNPARHFTFTGNGKPVPMDDNHHYG